MRLLLVEDDMLLATKLKKSFGANGYAIDHTNDGVEGQYLGEVEPYDVAILDLGLPGKPGLEILKCWRSNALKMPVIVLTARDAWHERVDGFRAGADDYLGKPFHFEELLERVRALIRRSGDSQTSLLQNDQFRLDEERQIVILPNECTVELTGTEC